MSGQLEIALCDPQYCSILLHNDLSVILIVKLAEFVIELQDFMDRLRDKDDTWS